MSPDLNPLDCNCMGRDTGTLYAKTG